LIHEAVRIFIESAQYAGVIDDKNYLQIPTTDISFESEKYSDIPDGANLEQPPIYQDPGFSNIGSRVSGQMASVKSGGERSITQLTAEGTTVSVPNSMEKQEITFRGGKKAYFILPVPLPIGEKERLKQWLDLIKQHIDLTLEDDPQPLINSQ
jgi:hypothetical protein